MDGSTLRVRDGLAAAGQRRAAAERERAEAMSDLTEWIRAAVGAGMEKSDIARLGRVSRQTVYAALGSPRD